MIKRATRWATSRELKVGDFFRRQKKRNGKKQSELIQ